jgi:predicted nucleotidyltransferase
MELGSRVPEVLLAHRNVEAVRLTGSRARGTATEHSDWDFWVDVTDFPAVANDLPRLVEPLGPLVGLWDPLSRHHVYAVLLPGPVKVDLVFDVPHELEPPWRLRAETLPAIDAHFWDWLLWLVGKRYRGETRLVSEELVKLHGHLLGPLGVAEAPATLEDALAKYQAARDSAEREYGIRLPRRIEAEVVSKVNG